MFNGNVIDILHRFKNNVQFFSGCFENSIQYVTHLRNLAWVLQAQDEKTDKKYNITGLGLINCNRSMPQKITLQQISLNISSPWQSSQTPIAVWHVLWLLHWQSTEHTGPVQPKSQSHSSSEAFDACLMHSPWTQGGAHLKNIQKRFAFSRKMLSL